MPPFKHLLTITGHVTDSSACATTFPPGKWTLTLFAQRAPAHPRFPLLAIAPADATMPSPGVMLSPGSVIELRMTPPRHVQPTLHVEYSCPSRSDGLVRVDFHIEEALTEHATRIVNAFSEYWARCVQPAAGEDRVENSSADAPPPAQSSGGVGGSRSQQNQPKPEMAVRDTASAAAAVDDQMLGPFKLSDARSAEALDAAGALMRIIVLAGSYDSARQGLSRAAFRSLCLRELVGGFAADMAATCGAAFPGLDGMVFRPDGSAVRVDGDDGSGSGAPRRGAAAGSSGGGGAGNSGDDEDAIAAQIARQLNLAPGPQPGRPHVARPLHEAAAGRADGPPASHHNRGHLAYAASSSAANEESGYSRRLASPCPHELPSQRGPNPQHSPVSPALSPDAPEFSGDYSGTYVDMHTAALAYELVQAQIRAHAAQRALQGQIMASQTASSPLPSPHWADPSAGGNAGFPVPGLLHRPLASRHLGALAFRSSGSTAGGGAGGASYDARGSSPAHMHNGNGAYDRPPQAGGADCSGPPHPGSFGRGPPSGFMQSLARLQGQPQAWGRDGSSGGHPAALAGYNDAF